MWLLIVTTWKISVADLVTVLYAITISSYMHHCITIATHAGWSLVSLTRPLNPVYNTALDVLHYHAAQSWIHTSSAAGGSAWSTSWDQPIPIHRAQGPFHLLYIRHSSNLESDVGQSYYYSCNIKQVNVSQLAIDILCAWADKSLNNQSTFILIPLSSWVCNPWYATLVLSCLHSHQVRGRCICSLYNICRGTTL